VTTDWKQLLEKRREDLSSEYEYLDGWEKLETLLLRAIEILEDTVDSGYDQAGHCYSVLAEIKAELELNEKE
jgi:hypothetical protein